MEILNCKDYFERELSKLRPKGRFAIILVGENPASMSYVRNKMKDAERIGLLATLYSFPIEVSRGRIVDLIAELNFDEEVSSIMLQMPLPEHLKGVEAYVAPEKDVDGFVNKSHFKPCTPEGIINFLERELNYDFRGKHAVVLGRGPLVGKPICPMLTDKDATVTLCHSKTKYIHPFTQTADLIICGMGQPLKIDPSYLNPVKEQVIVDAGISFCNRKLCGDVDLNKVSRMGDNIKLTPVPGGVGLLTRLTLMEHCCEVK